MPPSQLKRLKADLREKGILGPQKPKKQNKKNARNANIDQKVQRNAALAGIREAYNPFDVKAPVRPRKFDVTSNRPMGVNGVVGRPGVTKSLGEETVCALRRAPYRTPDG